MAAERLAREDSSELPSEDDNTSRRQEAAGVLLHVADDAFQGTGRGADRQPSTDGKALVGLDPEAARRYVAYDGASLAGESRDVEPVDQHDRLRGAPGIAAVIGLSRRNGGGRY